MGNTCDAWVRYQELAQVHGCSERVAVVYRLSSMLRSICVLGFQFCLAMCQIVSSYSMASMRCLRWVVQCEWSEFAGERSVGFWSHKIVEYSVQS